MHFSSTNKPKKNPMRVKTGKLASYPLSWLKYPLLALSPSLNMYPFLFYMLFWAHMYICLHLLKVVFVSLHSTLLRQDLYCFGCCVSVSWLSSFHQWFYICLLSRVVGVLGLTDSLYEGSIVKLACTASTFTYRVIFLGPLKQCLSVSLSLALVKNCSSGCPQARQHELDP